MPSAIIEETVIRIQNPKQLLAKAAEVAKAIHGVIEQQRGTKKLVVSIRGRDFLTVEAWQMFGAPFGVIAGVESVEPIIVGEADGKPQTIGYQARAQAYRHGVPISKGFGFSYRTEQGREEEPQCAGMAQTRAMSRALRHALAWVVVLAGYHPLPAEEAEGSKGELNLG